MIRWLHRLGAACAARPLVPIAVWVTVALTVTLLSFTVGGQFRDDHVLPGTQVQQGELLLSRHFPDAAAESADVLLTARNATRATLAASIPTVQVAIHALPHVAPGPLPVRLAADGATAQLHVRYTVPRFSLGSSDLRALQRAARSARRHGVDGFVTGSLYLDTSIPNGGGLGEKVGIGVAVLVLLVAFGSVIAALMPIATAALAILTGLGLVRLLSLVYAVDSSAPELATMIGLGVGIDYALFIVTRHREGLREDLDPQQAATAATGTAGASVLWAGVTVVAAICGLAFAGIPIMTSLGFASAIVVACSVASALTLLPALLSLTDRHIDRLHLPLPHLRHERVGARLDPTLPPRATWWTRWARGIAGRPVRYLVGGVVALVALALPAGAIRLGQPDGSSAAPASDVHRAFVLTARAFGPGANAPLTVAVTLPRGDAASAALGERLRTALSRDRDVASVSPLVLSPDRAVGVLDVVPRSAPQSAQTADLVPRLRDVVLRPVAQAAGVHAYVLGAPAARYDLGHRMLVRLPAFVGAVLAVSFLLLMVVFRSVLVPLKAVLLNLLSIAAALGVVVAVFTWGWLRALVGLSEPVPVVDAVPMLMFAIVFGLSMDYEVFLLSRVREEWVRRGDSRQSVVRGLTNTARIITAAAAIMVSIFVAFTLSTDVVVKMMGLGLAIAVLLDATVIRLVLVPATMSLLGDLNWWLPRWLDRLLPRISYDVADCAAQPTEVPIPRPTP